MEHRLCKEFYEYWESRRHIDGLPSLSEFQPEKINRFDGCGLVFKVQHSDIIADFLGPSNQEVLSADLVGRPITDMFPPALKAMQMALLMPCARQRLGIVRRSRLWFGHRHKDVEWLFLPVVDEQSNTTAIVGVAATFVEKDERDEVEVGSPLVERIVTQNYLLLGREADMSVIDSHTWAVLDSMGAQITVEGEKIHHSERGIAGDAGLVAAKVARPNVLAVANPEDIGSISQRLGGRYNLRIVDSPAEAREILKKDMVDILVTSETIRGTKGVELIGEAQKISAFTACVVMLDRRAEAEDARVEQNGSLVHCLVKPVGEFALRQALDDAGAHVDKARQDDTA